jgi:hypothetical protein
MTNVKVFKKWVKRQGKNFGTNTYEIWKPYHLPFKRYGQCQSFADRQTDGQAKNYMLPHKKKPIMRK